MTKIYFRIFIRVLFILLFNHLYLNAQTVYTIHSDQVLHQVDEKIYGQFLEHIYNSVNNGLWGDLIWNRSFERTSQSGSWYQEGDEIVLSSLNNMYYLLFGNVNWQDYEFTLQAKKEGGSGGFLILFRANGENYYWCNLDSQVYYIAKRTPGLPILGSIMYGSIQSDRWYDIRIRCEGDHFQVWLDGSELFNFVDSTSTVHLSGQVGIGTLSAKARYRNFLVTDIVSGDTLFTGLPTVTESEVTPLNWEKVGTGALYASGQALNSNFCVKLINSQHVEAGIEQRGLNLKVQPYRGSFWARGTTPGNIIIQLMQGTQSLAKKEFTAPGVDWKEYPFELTPTMETTNGTLCITFNDTGMVFLDQVSMMGQDAIDNDGFRPDLLLAVEALHPPCIRWPGGTFAEHYRWKDGIGLQHERGVYPRDIWNDKDVNSFGTDEFIALCRRLGAEPFIVINIGSSSSSVPAAEYIEEAQHWVEYCNGPASSTWGAKRAANDHPKPYDVKYWEFGNEVFFTLSVSEYVNFLNVFVPALKAVDPSIKIIASGSFDQKWNETVINSCADIIDFISIHNYENIGNYQGGVRSYEAYITELEVVIAASSNPNIKIYMSEWNVSSGLDWRNGLYAGGMLTMFERQGEYMHMAAPALFLRHSSADDWNNALINFNNSSWFPAPNYVVMKFWHDHYAPNFLETTGSNSNLNVSATRTEESKEIYFKVINASAKDIPVRLEIDGSFTPRGARLEQIAPSTLYIANNMETPDNIRVEEGNASIDSQRVNFTIPKYGAVIVTVSQDSTVEVDSHHPEDIQDDHLYANYPNPFNPITQINYSLPKNGYIALKVYNLLGQEVKTLFEGFRQRGNYTATFDASGLSSGIYLYRMTTENFTDTKKTILLK